MWRLLPVVLSLALLGAHFFRAGAGIALVVVLGLLVLLAVPQPWAARGIQLALVFGALEWLRTLWVLWAARSAAGQPALRLALILGAVALFTLASAAVFRSAALQRWYRLNRHAQVHGGT
jgi:hypothetical protein